MSAAVQGSLFGRYLNSGYFGFLFVCFNKLLNLYHSKRVETVLGKSLGDPLGGVITPPSRTVTDKM